MSAVTPIRAVAKSPTRRPPTVVGLAVLVGLLAVGGFQGGIAMVVDPLEPLGMSVSYLDGTPVDTYFWPGVFLLAIAAVSLVTVSGLAFGWRWQWAAGIEFSMGHTWPWLGAVAIGGVLLVFELIELFLIPFHPIMHPLLIAVSLAIIGLALTTSSQRHLSPRAVKA